MKKLDYRAILCIVFFSTLSTLVQAAEIRQWTSTKGNKVMAELVSKTDSHLTLRRDSGKEITLKITQLCEADQDYLKQLSMADTGDDAKPSDIPSDINTRADRPRSGKGKAGRLPVLDHGKGEGYFAYAEGDHYQARVNSNATMDIYLKDKDQTSGVLDGWKMIIQPVAYRKNKLGTISGLKIKEVIKHGEPIENPDQLKLSVMLKGGIQCELIYEFNEKGITTWMKSEHGDDPPEVMNHMMTHRLGEVIALTDDPKDLEKMRLKMRSDKYDYFGKYRISTTASHDRYEISMPALTDTKIIFDKGSDGETRLMCWKYADNQLSKGYFIRSRKGVFNSTKHNTEKTSITFKGK